MVAIRVKARFAMQEGSMECEGSLRKMKLVGSILPKLKNTGGESGCKSWEEMRGPWAIGRNREIMGRECEGGEGWGRLLRGR